MSADYRSQAGFKCQQKVELLSGSFEDRKAITRQLPCGGHSCCSGCNSLVTVSQARTCPNASQLFPIKLLVGGITSPFFLLTVLVVHPTFGQRTLKIWREWNIDVAGLYFLNGSIGKSLLWDLRVVVWIFMIFLPV